MHAIPLLLLFLLLPWLLLLLCCFPGPDSHSCQRHLCKQQRTSWDVCCSNQMPALAGAVTALKPYIITLLWLLLWPWRLLLLLQECLVQQLAHRIRLIRLLLLLLLQVHTALLLLICDQLVELLQGGSMGRLLCVLMLRPLVLLLLMLLLRFSCCQSLYATACMLPCFSSC